MCLESDAASMNLSWNMRDWWTRKSLFAGTTLSSEQEMTTSHSGLDASLESRDSVREESKGCFGGAYFAALMKLVPAEAEQAIAVVMKMNESSIE